MVHVGIACDCHNTLVKSNEAWIRAFLECVSEDKKNEISKCLYGKCKRRDLAKKYGVNYEVLEKLVSINTVANSEIISLLQLFKKIGIPIIVVSNAPLRRVTSDLKNAGIEGLFDRVFSEEDGGKNNLGIFDKIIDDYHLDKIMFIGNEEFDDYIPHPKVVSLVLTSYLLKRFHVLGPSLEGFSSHFLGDDM